MKKLFGIFLMVGGLGLASDVQAQSTVKKAGEKIEKGAKKAGNKTAEVASKGKSKVVHTEYEGKVGPNGETVYIDDSSRYYWIDKKGKKHYIQEAQLKDKVEQ
ncbi:MAG TPA: hypothetical protein VD794_09600 [Flavisolibacter sp.]|nr:hypothetical protein [Flavisolibacter sp.]